MKGEGGYGSGSPHNWLIAGAIILLIIVGISVAAVLTLTVHPDQPATPELSYPYSTTFKASLPDGEPVQVGTLDILALTTGDRAAFKIGERREEMVKGETREIGARTATVQSLGIRIFETGYRLSVTWTGKEGEDALFRIVLQTSRQVPDWLLSRILPSSITIEPI